VNGRTAVIALVMTPLILIAGLAALFGLAFVGFTRRVRGPRPYAHERAAVASVRRLETADVALRHAA
jgi:hypothetical protein